MFLGLSRWSAVDVDDCSQAPPGVPSECRRRSSDSEGALCSGCPALLAHERPPSHALKCTSVSGPWRGRQVRSCELMPANACHPLFVLLAVAAGGVCAFHRLCWLLPCRPGPLSRPVVLAPKSPSSVIGPDDDDALGIDLGDVGSDVEDMNESDLDVVDELTGSDSGLDDDAGA